jgi:hypothetical protein
MNTVILRSVLKPVPTVERSPPPLQSVDLVWNVVTFQLHLIRIGRPALLVLNSSIIGTTNACP